MRGRYYALAGWAACAGLLATAGAAQASAPGHLPVPATRQAPRSPAAAASAVGPRTLVVRLIRVTASTQSIYGCPYGYACMYTSSGFAKNSPEHEYYYYGCYDLSNETGTRYMVNNQSGSATVSGYYHYGCSSKAWTIPPPFIMEVDITPINSIGLSP